MAKITLNDINNISGNPTSAEQLLNANFTAIETAMENTLSRDGTAPNTLEAALDANSQRIVNLPYALTGTEPVTLAQVMALVTGEDWTGGAGIPAVVFYQPTQPTATASGQVWVNSTDLAIWIWTGGGWIRQEDPNLQATTALANGHTVQIEDIQPRLVVVENDSANATNAIIDIESDLGNIAGQIAVITADVGDNSAAIVSEQIARASGDGALAQAINTLQASNALVWVQPGAPVPGVNGIPNPIPEGSFWYDSDDYNKEYRYLSGAWTLVENTEYTVLAASISSEQSARISGDAALAVDVTNLWAQRNADYAYINTVNQSRIDGDYALSQQYTALNTTVGSLNATVISNNQARISGDQVNASSIQSTNTTVGSLSTTVSQHTTSINGIEGKYSVKIDANGYVSGFGLVATNNNATPTSIFTVLANNFRIVTPGNTPVTPFQVVGGTTYIKDVIIDTAAIGTATIGTLNMAAASIADVYTYTGNYTGRPGPNVAYNAWSNLTTIGGTVQITVPNLPTTGGPKVFLRVYLNAVRNTDFNDVVGMRIRRNDGVILPSSPTQNLDAVARLFSWEFVDVSPVSVSHTYTMQVSNQRSDTSFSVLGNWYDVQVVATVLKR